MSHQMRYSYSLSEQDVEQYVADHACVGDFLGKYEKGTVTYREKAVGLARFFRWLKVVKGLDITPEEFMNAHLKKRGGDSIEDRRWALKLALEYSRDNSDLKGKAANYVYANFFLPIKMFCDYHEAPLTTVTGLFSGRERRKHSETSFTVGLVKRILAVQSIREQAICLTELQSGQAIKQILVDVNGQAEYVFGEIDKGKTRIRLDFPERKGSNFAYFTFIGHDAIHAIQKWRVERRKILSKLGVDSGWIFITEDGEPLRRKIFHNILRKKLIRHKISTGPWSVRNHGFRKFFETEASPPDRGISKSYVSFMMGHKCGNGEVNRLDVPGGVYDPAPKVYPNAVEGEYAKLESYLNIFSEHRGSGEFSVEERERREIIDRLLADPDVKDLFEKVLRDKLKSL